MLYAINTKVLIPIVFTAICIDGDVIVNKNSCMLINI